MRRVINLSCGQIEVSFVARLAERLAYLVALPFQICTAPQVEGYLEEMLLLAQRAEEYNQFMLAKMGEAVAPAPLSAARHNAFR